MSNRIRKYIATVAFTVQPAQGPNRDGHSLEVLDDHGDRLAYVSSIDDAAEEMKQVVDPAGLYDTRVLEIPRAWDEDGMEIDSRVGTARAGCIVACGNDPDDASHAPGVVKSHDRTIRRSMQMQGESVVRRLEKEAEGASQLDNFVAGCELRAEDDDLPDGSNQAD